MRDRVVVHSIGWIAASLVIAAACSHAAQAQERWTLVEEVRIGSIDEGPAMFSDLRGLGVGANGDVYVLDYRAQEIRQFNPRGDFVRKFGRSGSGPGEMRNANGMLMAPDGRIWVNDPANSRFTVFDASGAYDTTHTVPIQGYGFVWSAMFDTAGVLYDQVFLTDEPHRAIRRLRASGAVIDTVSLPTCGRERRPEEMTFQARTERGGRMMGIPFVPRPITAWDPRGFMWCTPSDVFEVVQIRLGPGDTALRVTRDVSPPPVTSAEREAAIARARENFKAYPNARLDFSRIPRVKPVIAAMHVDEAGRLWVRRTDTDTLRAVFDVFDQSGRHVATAEGRMRFRFGIAPVVRGDAFYAIVLDEDDVQYVIRARIRRSSR